jgi:hypothetical protein
MVIKDGWKTTGWIEVQIPGFMLIITLVELFMKSAYVDCTLRAS